MALVTQFKVGCFELVFLDAALIGSPVGETFSTSALDQHREEFG